MNKWLKTKDAPESWFHMDTHGVRYRMESYRIRGWKFTYQLPGRWVIIDFLDEQGNIKEWTKQDMLAFRENPQSFLMTEML